MTDPAGGRSRGLLQASRRSGDMRTRDGGGKGNTVGNPVVHFEIGGVSVERTRAFYSELFGWAGPMPVRGIGAFAMLGDPDGNIVGLFREAA